MTTVTEDFTGGAGTLGGPKWETPGSSPFVGMVRDGAGRALAAGVTTYSLSRLTGTWNADQWAQCVITSYNFDAGGPALRVQSNGDCYLLVTASIYRIFKLPGFAAIADSAIAPVNGDVVRFEIIGTTLNLYRNTILILTTTDPDHAAGNPGLQSYDGSSLLDDYIASDSFGGPIPESFLEYSGTQRKRPGRGPYSSGRYFRPRIDAHTRFGGTTYSQSVGGVLAPTGALTKKTNKIIVGGLTPTGTLTKKTNKGLAGALTFAGAITKKTVRALTAGLTFNGSLSTGASLSQDLTGGLTFSGGITKKTIKALDGGLTFVGTVSKKTTKMLVGALTPTGALHPGFRTRQLLTGAVSFAGTAVGIIGSIPTVVSRFWKRMWGD